MSRDGSILLTFTDGEEYVFRLAWGALIKLQESRKCGPFVVFERLHNGDWMVEDIRDVIRFGLVGGGMDEVKARKLVREYVEDRPPLRTDLDNPETSVLAIAVKVIDAGLLGPPDEEPLEKKVEMAANGSTISTTVGSASPSSLASAH